MSLRQVLGTAAVAALAAALVGLPAPPTAGGELRPAGEALPPCPAGIPESSVPVTAPVSLPTLDDPAACRARPTRVEPVDAGALPVPAPARPGYHHLGATTADGYAGVLGRLTVRDPAVRAGSRDFVATRFMAKRSLGEGRVAWLEVGWAETGWSGGGAQRVYAFDSDGRAWVFFDEYRLADGDQVWVYLHRGQAGWRAWLWWGERWHLLTTPELPLGQRARLEQYVEIHLDRRAAGPAVSVPPIRVDNVRVQGDPGGRLAEWRAGTVPSSVTPPARGGYCLAWQTAYDTWSAGDCAATVQE